MRDHAVQLLQAQVEAAQDNIHNCELQILDCYGDHEAVSALQRVQTKHEALADLLETEIQALKK
jgi:hypothetical protein